MFSKENETGLALSFKVLARHFEHSCITSPNAAEGSRSGLAPIKTTFPLKET